jgi:hypothetical protein
LAISLLVTALPILVEGDAFDSGFAGVAGAQSTTFRETWDGNPSTPQRWQPSNWDITLTGNRNEPTLISSMNAHHGPACQPPKVDPDAPFHYQRNPLVTHPINSNEQTAFLCRGHMMTAVNTGGYAAIYLTPNHMADFSQGESVIQFDMSTLRTSARDWVDFVIMPFEDNQQLNFQDASIPANAVHIEMFLAESHSLRHADVQRLVARYGDQPRPHLGPGDRAAQSASVQPHERRGLPRGMLAQHLALGQLLD